MELLQWVLKEYEMGTNWEDAIEIADSIIDPNLSQTRCQTINVHWFISQQVIQLKLEQYLAGLPRKFGKLKIIINHQPFSNYMYRVSKFCTAKGPFTRAIFVAIFLLLTHAIECLSHKSIDLYSFATDGLIHS